MTLATHELARRDEAVIAARDKPFRLRWELSDLPACDGHRLVCTFACSARILDPPAERKLLEEIFLGDRDVMTIQDVVAHFSAAMFDAARRVASDWRATDADETVMLDALTKAASGVAFACGIEILPPFQLQMHSPTLAQQKVQQMHRELARRQSEDRFEHLARCARLLEQFHELRRAAPQLSPGQVLQMLGPDDRAAMLEASLVAAPSDTVFWAVAGHRLVRIRPANPDPRVDIDLPVALGPARSVQQSHADRRHELLIGVRDGVLRIDPSHPDSPRLAESRAGSQHGFTRAVLWNGSLWACHSETGIVRWKDGDRLASQTLTREQLGGPPRHLQPLDSSRLIFAVEGRTMTLDAGGEFHLIAQHHAEIVAIVMAPVHAIVVHADGRIVRFDRATLDKVDEHRRPARLVAAAAMPWLGGVRLVLADENGSIDCVGLDDPLVTQYLSAHRGVRMLAAGEAWLAAVSADRQRVILWSSAHTRAPAAELNLLPVARQRVADLSAS